MRASPDTAGSAEGAIHGPCCQWAWALDNGEADDLAKGFLAESILGQNQIHPRPSPVEGEPWIQQAERIQPLAGTAVMGMGTRQRRG